LGCEGDATLTGIRSIDVVIVAYNSRPGLRRAVEPLTRSDGVRVIVVDNASPEGGLETIGDLDVTAIQLESNGGFAHGCNVGWRAGGAPDVLFLNPDAVITPEALDALAGVLRHDDAVGIVAPKIVRPGGGLEFSQRSFPRLRSTYARALFLHRIMPRSTWSDELVREPASYASVGTPDWVSGACFLIRRSLLERLAGWEERFFMYCEDIDLCARVRGQGYEIRFEPRAVVEHEGGASAPRANLIPVLAASRLLYAEMHRSRPGAFLERIGLMLEALTHAALSKRGATARAGHARALRLLAGSSGDAT
jgi:N-acetylglucosaminyl-diphospho-decaprenol L-rhamnosyltransferase